MDNSAILQQAFTNFILQIGSQQVPLPYHINIPPNEHPARQGKSSPEVILKQLYEDAQAQQFDLESASVSEIRAFMEKNKLGLDCSGFVYRMLDLLLEKLQKGNLQDLGLPHVGRTNVLLLTSPEFTQPVESISQIRPGDIIKLASDKEIPHCAIIISASSTELVYAHSSSTTQNTGVHTSKILVTSPGDLRQQNWLERTREGESYHHFFNGKTGDRVVRLKALT